MDDKIVSPWMIALQTAEMAKPAADTARNIIFAVLDMTPDTNDFCDDPFTSFNVVFRHAWKFSKTWD